MITYQIGDLLYLDMGTDRDKVWGIYAGDASIWMISLNHNFCGSNGKYPFPTDMFVGNNKNNWIKP